MPDYPGSDYMAELRQVLPHFAPHFIDVAVQKKMKDKRRNKIMALYEPIHDLQFDVLRITGLIETSYIMAMNDVVTPVLAAEYCELYYATRELIQALPTMNQFSEMKKPLEELKKVCTLKKVSDLAYKDLEAVSVRFDPEANIKLLTEQIKKGELLCKISQGRYLK